MSFNDLGKKSIELIMYGWMRRYFIDCQSLLFCKRCAQILSMGIFSSRKTIHIIAHCTLVHKVVHKVHAQKLPEQKELDLMMMMMMVMMMRMRMMKMLVKNQ